MIGGSIAENKLNNQKIRFKRSKDQEQNVKFKRSISEDKNQDENIKIRKKDRIFTIKIKESRFQGSRNLPPALDRVK